MGKLMVVVGGQFGSEAKGACAAALAAKSTDPLVIRTGGPNAGHTVWRDGVEYKLRQLPTAAVSNPNARLAIAAGSIVDPGLLAKEIAETALERYVYVDEMATVLDPEYVDEENYAAKQLNNWSTQKGIGAARSARIMRTARVWRDLPPARNDDSIAGTPGWSVCSDVAYLARRQLATGGDVIIEAAQGYGLGLHTTYYPKTTSADCRAVDALAAVGLSPWEAVNEDRRRQTAVSNPLRPFSANKYELEVWVVMRPYPIRVAGESGSLRGETTWEALGLPEEHTTVTNKVRRVGTWDTALAEAAILANGGPSPAVRVWFSMADQVIPELAGVTDETFWGINGGKMDFDLTKEVLEQIQDWRDIVEVAGAKIHVMGTGPSTYITLESR